MYHQPLKDKWIGPINEWEIPFGLNGFKNLVGNHWLTLSRRLRAGTSHQTSAVSHMLVEFSMH